MSTPPPEITKYAEIIAYLEPGVKRFYSIEILHGLFTLHSDEGFLADSQYPKTPYAIYDPIVGEFIGIHARAFFATGTNRSPPYWVIKQQHIELGDCPEAKELIEQLDKLQFPDRVDVRPSRTPPVMPRTPSPSPVPSSVNGETDYDTDALNGPDAFKGLGKRKRATRLVSIGTVNIIIHAADTTKVANEQDQGSKDPSPVKGTKNREVQAGPEIIVISDDDEPEVKEPPAKKTKGKGKQNSVIPTRKTRSSRA